MEYRSLGRSGLKVSTVGLGCMNFGMMVDQSRTDAVVNKAFDLGVTLFDTANIYGGEQGKGEEMLGKALGSRRKDIILATKFGGQRPATKGSPGGGSRNAIFQTVEESLQRLGTDYIDLYQIHRPDTSTPIEETLSALDDLVRQGKVRYIGCSNFDGWLLVEAQWTAQTSHLTAFVSAQNRYSLVTRDVEKELVPACNLHGVGILPFFPLESGLLTGKYARGVDAPEGTRLAKWGGAFQSDDKYDKLEKLTDLGQAHGHSILDIAIGWLVSRPHVSSVIAGVTSPEQLEKNVAAGESTFTAEELAAIDEITAPAQSGFGPPRR